MQSTHGVSEVALGLALIVGLGVALRGERPVGDLGFAAAGVGVVDGGTTGVHSTKRRPATCAARQAALRSARSPLGSTMTAAMP